MKLNSNNWIIEEDDKPGTTIHRIKVAGTPVSEVKFSLEYPEFDASEYLEIKNNGKVTLKKSMKGMVSMRILEYYFLQLNCHHKKVRKSNSPKYLSNCFFASLLFP